MVDQSFLATKHIPGAHWDTPSRVRIQTQVQLVESESLRTQEGKRYPKRRLFAQHRIPTRTAYRILRQADPRRLGNSEIRQETRGRKKGLDARDLRALESIVQRNGQEGRVLSWEALGIEANLEFSGRTIQRAMGSMNYRRCIACQKSWVSAGLAAKRLDWATYMLSKYPTLEDWRNVRFSDETHLGFGAQGKIWVIRKPGERSCPDCLQEVRIPKEKDQKKVHAWAVIGYDYKSKLYCYDNGTSNGKLDQKTYIGLLEKECLDWPKDWVLEEDNDSGHGPSKNNPVRRWKEAHNLKHYFNCPHSPDLSPIENAWQAPKATLRKFAYWDDNIVWELALEGWAGLSQETINKWCNLIPQRLQNVIDLKGKLSSY